jgi:hypothetical protein
MSSLTQLEDWYHAQCNGDWEHGLGVKIETLDNPGWLLMVDLEDTSLEEVSFPGVSYGVGRRANQKERTGLIARS